MEDISNHIPCELCHELIHMNNFENHLNTCIMVQGRHQILNMVENPGNISLNNISRLLNIVQYPEEDSSFSDEQDLNENINFSYQTPIPNNETPPGRFNQTEISTNISQGIVFNLISNILGIPYGDNENLTELFERVGVVEKGIDNIEDVSCLVSGNDNLNCPICQAECKIPIRKTLCNHSFCDSCISHWLSKSKKCPSCMQDLEELFKENILKN